MQQVPDSIVPISYRHSFLLPLWVLAFLLLFPPHAFDIAVSHLFYESGAWPWHDISWFSWVFHKLAKAIPVVIALGGIVLLVRDAIQRRRGTFCVDFDPTFRKRLLYLLTAMLVAVLFVWRLKAVTGVACPWDVNLFGGNSPIRDPSFSLFRQAGNCWPAGHAGTGFCLFALYFFWRDASPAKARIAFWSALLFGTLCGWIRVMQGAHFVSHFIVTGLIDWLICASLYVLFFARHTILDAFRRILPSRWPMRSYHAAVWGTALWWTLVFDMGYYRQLLTGVASNPEVAASVLSTLGTSVLLFLFVSVALLYLLACLPKKLFVTIVGVFNLLGGLSLVAALLYGVIMTPDMIRNFLATNTQEALGYLSLRTAFLFLFLTLPPFIILLRAKRHNPRWQFGLLAFLALVAGTGTVFLGMQGLSSAMRNDKSLRYQIAPANIVYSTLRTLTTDSSPDARIDRIVVDANPTQGVKPTGKSLFVVVIGETTRSANWHPAGYERNTTPKLGARKDVIHYPRVAACGTSTDVSLPCMLSRVGRRDYDRDRIVSEESLPALLARAGYSVTWIDNQSGCKGTCAGVTSRRPVEDPKLCPSGRCFDEVMVNEINAEVEKLENGRPAVVFLHLMGSHGPAYWARSPENAKPFGPECREADLGSCKRETITAAYDNSVRYTDHVVAGVIESLAKAERSGVATGLVFVSDHGESLGENGLFLHGTPYWMAPDEQLEVPMVVWLSDTFTKTFGVVREKLLAARNADVRHDHLFHTILGLLRVQSSAYDNAWDLSH